jgi:hypothetical protein
MVLLKHFPNKFYFLFFENLREFQSQMLKNYFLISGEKFFFFFLMMFGNGRGKGFNFSKIMPK